jgi:DNA-binding NtrC family response regulator
MLLDSDAGLETFRLERRQQSLTVLVVDDEALLLWSIAETLRRGGHTVIEATSAKTALDAMRHNAIDVLLLDVHLPDSNDLRVLEDARRRLPDSAVVLMTAFSTPELVQAALERGAYCVLNKPFDMHDVETVIAEAHRASELR